MSRSRNCGDDRDAAEDALANAAALIERTGAKTLAPALCELRAELAAGARQATRRALIVVLVSFISSCGLIFQGTTRNVRVSTQPEGAAIKLGDKEAVSPAGVTLSRRLRNNVVYRATKDGYRPACRVIDCRPPPWVKVFDSIPAAIPLLIDLAAGALGNCADATLVLEPVQPGDATFELPNDAFILYYGEGVCAFPYFFDSGFAAKAARIIVSVGGLQQPYALLGNVDFGKLGFDRTEAGAVAFHGVVWAWAHRVFSKPTPAEINDLLRKQALYQYGDRVDALINVNYQSDPANSVFATAVAVHFTDNDPHAGTASTRLKELETLRRDGLIGEREYEQKRAEILQEL